MEGCRFIRRYTGGLRPWRGYCVVGAWQERQGLSVEAHGNSFYEVAVILGLAGLLGALGQKLRQPLVIMFLATGILAGPAVLGVIESHGQIELLADMGIALLLFIVGMRLDVHLIKLTGPVALATGLGQIFFTSAIGLVIALAMGMHMLEAAYVAVALTFSSTIIIVKLLSDKKEIDSLHGRIALGFLIVQDIAAILALVALTTIGSGMTGEGGSAGDILKMLLQGGGLLVGVAVMARYGLPPLLRRLAQSQEMLVLSAITWAVLLSALSDQMGFSKEVGAFLAGVAIASTEYRDAIGARLTSLRDFLLLFFFISLGARLEWAMVGSQLGASAVFSVFVLVGNPLIVLAIMGFMGYRRRTGFLAGLTVAQISEFSLIVAALGLSLGHISPETMGLITLVGVITIFASTYMILYSGQLYGLLAEPLRFFERTRPYQELAGDSAPQTEAYDVVLVGLGNYGNSLAEHLLMRRKRIMGVDFDPDVLENWRARGVPVVYGDMGDPEIIESLPLGKTRWIVNSIRNAEFNQALFRMLQQKGYAGKIALTAVNESDAETLAELGADVVLQPLTDAAEQAVEALESTVEVLPIGIEWPLAFREIRLSMRSTCTGKRLADIALPSTAGVSILAISRAGNVHYQPGGDFVLYPGDGLVIMGPPDVLNQAEAALNQTRSVENQAAAYRFDTAEVLISPDSEHIGKTLEELRFRQTYGVTVVGISRGLDKIFPGQGPQQRLQARDVLIVIGLAEKVLQFKRQPWI